MARLAEDDDPGGVRHSPAAYSGASPAVPTSSPIRSSSWATHPASGSGAAITVMASGRRHTERSDPSLSPTPKRP